MADNVEIQGLEFQIQENSATAVSGLEALRGTLEKLKTVTQGGVSGLRTTANQIKAIADAASKIDGNTANKIKTIAGALTSLKNLGNVKLSSTIATQLTSLSTALRNIQWTDGDRLEALANGLKSLTALGRSNLTSFITQLGKLPQVIKDLDEADLDKFTRQMKELAASIKPFADEMNKVSAGFSAFPSRIQAIVSSTSKYNAAMGSATSSTRTFGTVLSGLKFTAVIYGLRRVAGWIGTAITKSNEYQENLNLFTVAMGEYAKSAQDYAEQVADIMGIDPSDWMRNQGVFNTLLTGFGNVADRAALMSKNLTQLGYDLSSFFNISIEDAMQKLQSGISGELEPLRRLGYDLSQARLEAVALSLGIDKSVTSMTQAEKAELRYYAIMTQVTTAQGDLARTLESPANQLRILQAQFTQAARAIGNIFIPALNAILPYAIAVVQAIREIAEAIASLFNFELTEVDYSGVGNLGTSAGVAADNLGDAASAAKALQQYTAGIDELNVFSPSASGGGGAGGGAGGGGGFDFELPEYDFLGEAVNQRVEEIKKKIEPVVSWIKDNIDSILETVVAIGAAMLSWKIANSLLNTIEYLKSLSSKSLTFGIEFKVLGLSMFLGDLNEFLKYFRDFEQNGATFQNVAGMISEFAGMVGDALLLLGNVKTAAALKAIQGIGEIVVAIKDISENGVNWENALTAVRGLTNIAIAIGLFTGNIKVAAWSVAIQGFNTIIQELATNWEAIRNGDWSGVDKATLIVGGLEILGGVAVAMDAFSKLKGTLNSGGAVKAVSDMATETKNLDASISTGLNPKLTDLAKNLAVGLAIILEVIAAAALFVGGIALLGVELQAVATSWDPVLANGDTVLTALGLGSLILAGIGAAAYGLGTVGTTVAVNIALGTAILLELGVAAGLFIVEIWAIGKGLDEIGKAWQPVLDNGETISAGIGLGTALLVGIGVVTAALGVATVASVGLLPLAVGLGTAILVELAVAFVAFTESLVDVADELSQQLAPALSRLNKKLPGLTDDLSDFVDFMVDLAEEISSYTKSMGSVTWSSIVGSFQKLFANNPIADFADDINDIYKDTSTLNSKLELANPELEKAVELLTDYSSLMDQMQILTSDNGTRNLATGIFTNLKDCGEKLVTGFSEGMSNKMSLVKDSTAKLKENLDTGFDSIIESISKKWEDGIEKMTESFSNFTKSLPEDAYAFKGSLEKPFSELTPTLNANWGNLWKGLASITVVQWNAILATVSNGINKAVTSLNSMVRDANAMSSKTGVSLPYFKTVSIPKLASGGFVDEGQLFIAREAGAEMVGNIGRKTAVANNDQIVESISNGVTVANEGVIAAIYALIQALEEKEMSVSIGDDDIGQSYDRYNSRRGVRVNTGAFANAY